MSNEHKDIESGEEPAVDRSRLKMLGVLAAAGATGGCAGAPRRDEYRTFGTQSYPKDDDEPMGGEGGGGDGGSH